MLFLCFFLLYVTSIDSLIAPNASISQNVDIFQSKTPQFGQYGYYNYSIYLSDGKRVDYHSGNEMPINPGWTWTFSSKIKIDLKKEKYNLTKFEFLWSGKSPTGPVYVDTIDAGVYRDDEPIVRKIFHLNGDEKKINANTVVRLS